MCFGDTKTSTDTKQTITNPLVQNAAAQNLSFVQNLQNQGFQPYTGNQVADFGPLQNRSFGMAGNIADTGVQYVPEAYSDINSYGSAGPSSVAAGKIYQNMDPYMSQYVGMALAPQLAAQQQQFDAQNRAANSNATMAGAFGNDSQDALYRSNLSVQQDLARQGLIGNAYNAAFNTAIGAGAQDVANNLNAQTTNAGLNEQALQRQLGAAGALQGLGSYYTNTGINQAELLNRYGAQQTAQGQAGLNAAYNQWLMAQQYPFQTAQLLNSTIGAGNQGLGTTTTETKSQPDNSGYQMLGTLGGTLLGGMMGGPLGASVGSSLGGMLGSGFNNLSGGATTNGGYNSSVFPTQFAQNYGTPSQLFPGYGGGPTGYGGNYASYAKGGHPAVGQPALVGEQGPELFEPNDGGQPQVVGQHGPEVVTPTKPGTVVSHDELEARRKAKGGDKGEAKEAKSPPSPKPPTAKPNQAKPAPKPKPDGLATMLGAAA